GAVERDVKGRDSKKTSSPRRHSRGGKPLHDGISGPIAPQGNSRRMRTKPESPSGARPSGGGEKWGAPMGGARRRQHRDRAERSRRTREGGAAAEPRRPLRSIGRPEGPTESVSDLRRGG